MRKHNFQIVFIVFFILSVSFQCKRMRSSDKVVIGILTLPSSYSDYPYQKYSQIVRSYVQNIQDSGKALTVPIHWDSTEEELDDILSKVNGVFFTGGGVQFMEENSVEQYYLKTVTYIIKKSKSFNDDDNYFPIWGTCLGFQVINYVTAGNDLSIMIRNLGDTASHNLYDIDLESKLFKDMPKDLINWLQEGSPAFFSHEDGIIKSQAEENESLSQNVIFTSLSKTDDGEEFIASIEFQDYPIYAVQFHPEKNLFDPKVDAKRDELSFNVCRYFVEFFIKECQKNKNSFENKQEIQKLRVDNFQWVEVESSHTSLYFLENASNEDIDYDDRYGPRHLFTQTRQNSKIIGTKQRALRQNKIQ
ncbi:hypothetical protein ABPG72_021112 [Tetrahymena utriculariae]